MQSNDNTRKRINILVFSYFSVAYMEQETSETKVAFLSYFRARKKCIQIMKFAYTLNNSFQLLSNFTSCL